MAQATIVKGLAESLLTVVSDPARLDWLYSILGEYCHQFRNRLNSLKLSLYLARRAGSTSNAEKTWEELEQKYRELEVLVEQLQMISRPIRLASIRTSLGDLLDERSGVWAEWLKARGKHLELLRPTEPALGRFDPTRLTQGLDALASWRAAAGPSGGLVRVRWWQQDGRLRLNWEEPETEPHGNSHPDRSPSLALPVLGRVISAHGGSLTISLNPGLHFCLEWPGDDANG